MRPRPRTFIAVVLLFPLVAIEISAASVPANTPKKAAHEEAVRPRTDGNEPGATDDSQVPTTLGPAPQLGPIFRFIPPIDPWVQNGLGWGEAVFGPDGEPVCSTNRQPAASCDPTGPRPFVHTGFDALPAPDRAVKASAVGRVVFVGTPLAPLVGGRCEAGGVVLIEHDLDGNPGTSTDRLVTIYEHVEPLVGVGAIVQQGEVIARTSMVQGRFLHFGVRRAPFNPSGTDVFRGSLPPEGTTGCLACYGRPLPLPSFPEQWEDPADLFRRAGGWSELIDGGDAIGLDVVETPDGYLIGGSTLGVSPIQRDMWLARIDANGKMLSQRAYRIPGGSRLVRLVATPDGGYLALSAAGSVVPVLVKFDASAEHIEWQTAYQIGAGKSALARDLSPAPDGGWVITGSLFSSGEMAFVLKVDPNGGAQWARTFSHFSAHAAGLSVAPAMDGGYGVSLIVNEATGPTFTLARLDAAGHLLWDKSYKDAQRLGPEVASQIQATPDGGFAIVGNAPWVRGEFSALWYLELRSDGSIEQEHLYSTSSFERTNIEWGSRMMPTSDGGRILVGGTYSTDFDHGDLLMVKIDAQGNVLSQRALDSRSARDGATAVTPTRDGGVVIVGGSPSDLTPAPHHLLVAKLGEDLDVPNGCGIGTTAQPLARSSLDQGAPSLPEASPAVMTSTFDISPVDTEAKAYPCDDRVYGAPPMIQSFSALVSERPVSCDFAQFVEDFVCALGVPGVHATSPVLVSGAYDALSIQARVLDADSTADPNDIVAVQAGLLDINGDLVEPIPLLDDGSTVTRTADQFYNYVGEDCFDEPITGQCFCDFKRYSVSSGDASMGDSLYTSNQSFVSRFRTRIFADCVLRNGYPVAYGVLPAPADWYVDLRAVDRLGNVTTWPTPAHITTSTGSESCSGDACGCCLLLNGGLVTSCYGLEGLTSPDFPCGICVYFGAGSCAP